MLESLLNPQSVAVIGASKSPGKVGHEILANLQRGAFGGPIVPVNPSAEEVLGIKCYPSLKAYGQKIDLSVISVPNKGVMAAVEDSIAAGAGAICVITAGFKEVGEKGAALEKELADLCRRHNVDLLGPNCLGLINTHHKMNASFAAQMPQPGGISVISQSGALCTAILDWAVARPLGLAKLLSMGNKADISENQLLRALGDDPLTTVIVGYLESINSGDEFIRAAETAAGRKPVVVFKSGTTAAGTKAASSHTGSLAGADMAYGAAFKRAGVIRAETFESLFDYATALAMQPLPKGNRVAIITNAGGPGIMAADAVENSGLKVTALTPAIAAALKEKLPAAASVGNPVDVLGDADAPRYALALEAVLGDPQVDAAVVILTPQAMTQAVATAQAVAAHLHPEKPVLASFMGGHDVLAGRAELVKCGIPDYPAPERAVAALKAMADYAAWRNRPARVVTRFPVNQSRVERTITRSRRNGLYQLGEAQAKDILRAYGFLVPDGALAGTAEEASDVAVKVGFPVAMKIASPDVIHKSDLGGVKLNLASVEEVHDAYDLMMLRIQRKLPEARLDGVYVEKMCPRGREVILGMTRDPQFGPMLMFGLGGIFVEVMKDVTFHLAPITAEEALEMLRRTKSYALLEGVRGQASVDIAAIGTALQRISQLATDFPEIMEMDINPFIVGEVGKDSVAADGRITLAK